MGVGWLAIKSTNFVELEPVKDPSLAGWKGGVVSKTTLSNEKKGYIGDEGWNTTQLCGELMINHEIRIPSLNNPDFNGK